MPRLRESLASQLWKLVRQQLPALRGALKEQFSQAQAARGEMGNAVQAADAKLRLQDLIDEAARKIKSHVEADGVGPFRFWTALNGHYKSHLEACFKARPRFMAGSSELDSWDLIGLDKQVPVMLRDWGDWRKLTAVLDGSQTVTGAVTVNGQRLSKGWFPAGQAWEPYPDLDGDSPLIWLKNRTGELKTARLPTGWRFGWHKAGRAADGQGCDWCTYSWRPTAMLQEEEPWPLTLLFERADEGSGNELSVSNISARIAAARGRELPLPGGPASSLAAQRIHLEAVDRWKKPTHTCVKGASTELRGLVRDVVAEHFGAFPRLAGEVAALLQALIDRLKPKIDDRAAELLKQEEARPSTQSSADLKASFDRAQQELRVSLGYVLQEDSLSKEERADLAKLLRKAGLATGSRVVCAGEHDDAVLCAATAHAYYKIAFKRFTDNIPRTIDELLLRQFCADCRKVLTTGLGVMHSDDEELVQWFEEDAATSQKRRELDARLQRQREGLELLDRALAK